MPKVFPFKAVSYTGAADVSHLIAPPYDVLDLKAKERLLKGHAANIAAIDLPHVPAKELGPPETYQAAGDRYRDWLAAGTLKRREKPAMFAYRQTFDFGGVPTQRCGMALG